MRKLLLTASLATLYLVGQAFVLKVTNIPEEAKDAPLKVKSLLDNRTLDSLKIEGKEAVLHGTVDGTEICEIGYTFPKNGGMYTAYNHIIINNNDTVWLTFTDSKGGIRQGGDLNAKLQVAIDSTNNLAARFSKGEISHEDIHQMGAKYLTEQITENISNLYGGYMLAVSSYTIAPDEWFELYHQLPSEIAVYPLLANTAMRLKSQIETQEGAMFKDFQCLTPERNSVRLSDYVGKGKYTLLDFWATWCGPCRQEAKETILPIYEKYKDNDNFRVLSVMTSDSIDNHLRGLSTLNYPWQQLIDVDDISGNLFGFNSIPFITLIDPEGRIIRRDIRGEEIWQAVEAVLNKD